MSSNNNNLPVLLGAGVLLALAFSSKKIKETIEEHDPKFISNLNKDKQQLMNISILLGRMKAKGVTNKYAQAAILSIISKESEFIPQSENLNYTATQIGEFVETIGQAIGKVFNVNQAKANELAHNPEALANYVYGGKGGNGPTEGYKYRGRGFNQITFKDTYKKIGKQIGYDLVGNPDLLNNPIIAADAAIQYFQNGIDQGKALHKLAQYNATGINDFKSLDDAVNAIYNINAGWGSSKAKILADVTGGRKKAVKRAPELYKLVTLSA